jgi:peroxiredoxin
LQAVYGDVTKLGGDVAVLSAELPEVSAKLAANQKLAFPILHDKGLAIAKSFGLVFTLPDDLVALYKGFGIDLPKNTGHAAWELPIPARFVIDKSGVVRSADVDPDYTRRPEATATLDVLRKL